MPVPARVFERFNDNAQNRYFNLLRRHAYARATVAAEKALPWLKGRLALSCFDKKMAQALCTHWLPAMHESNEVRHSERTVFASRLIAEDGSLMRWDSSPHYFGLALWSGGQLCALAATTIQQRHDDANVMAVNLVAGTPEPIHPLRGYIGPIVQFGALAWADMLTRSEIHYLGPFSAAGERMMQRLGNFGFKAEPRGCENHHDTMRYSVGKNIHLLKVD